MFPEIVRRLSETAVAIARRLRLPHAALAPLRPQARAVCITRTTRLGNPRSLRIVEYQCGVGRRDVGDAGCSSEVARL